MRELPPEVALLGAKDVRPGDCFVLHGESDRCFTVTRAAHILGVDGQRARFTENDVWERFEQIEKCSRETFEAAAAAYREERWRQRGQPDSRELTELAARFCAEYEDAPEGGGWHWVCRYDEETLLRLAERAAGMAVRPGTQAEAAARRKLARKMYRDLVLAKALDRKGR